MIADGNPWKLKLKPKGRHVHYDDANMLYFGEEDERGARWIGLGHVAPLNEAPRNQAKPRLQGCPT